MPDWLIPLGPKLKKARPAYLLMDGSSLRGEIPTVILPRRTCQNQ